METKVKIAALNALLVSMVIILARCNSATNDPRQKPISITFGERRFEVDSLHTSLDKKRFKSWTQAIESTDSVLNLNDYRTWEEFVDSVTEICCKNRNPAIVLNDGKRIKRVLLSNFCPLNYGCVLLKERNVIEIYDDSVIKYKTYSMDSFENILRRDIENNGKVPEWCDHPKKLIIYIDLSKLGLKALPKLLERITDSYYKVTGKTNVRINLVRPYEIKIPLPEKR